MKIVFDTNVLSELMKPQGSQKVKNWVATQAKVDLFVTSITQAEILYGIAGQLKNSFTNFCKIVKLMKCKLRNLSVLGYNSRCRVK